MTLTRRHRDVAAGTTVLLALDSSSTCTGWAVFDGELPVAFGQYQPEAREHGAKLAEFIAWLMDLLDQYDPDEVCYEKPYPGREKHTFGVLQMYIGAILCAHYMHFGSEVPDYNRIPAKDVKRINGMSSGNLYEVNKANAVQLVNQVYQLQLKYDPKDRSKRHSQDDTADALLVGRARLLQGGAHG